jgi:hypothetical protein
MKAHRPFAAVLGGLVVVLVLVLPGVLLPLGSAGMEPLPGSLALTVFVYLPYVDRQDPQPSATPTSTSEPIGPLPPLQIAPADGATLDTISPSLSIDNSALGQPARARLQYSPDADFTSNVSGFGFYFFQGTATALLYWNLDAGTTYYWRVCSSLDGANWGEWSEVWSFTTASGGTVPDAPTLIEPGNGSTVSTLRPTLTWSPVPGATHYAVAIANSVYVRSVTEFPVPFDLDPGTAYKWSASARNTYGWGADSDEWTFTTPSGQGISRDRTTGTTYGISAGRMGPFFDRQGAEVVLHPVSEPSAE